MRPINFSRSPLESRTLLVEHLNTTDYELVPLVRLIAVIILIDIGLGGNFQNSLVPKEILMSFKSV
jgi:hypothetical protein